MNPRPLVLLLLAIALAPGCAAASGLRAAVAANLQPAFEEMAAQLRARHGIDVEASYGSSGKLFAQVENGAPFHFFLAADQDYPRRLRNAGLTLGAPRSYALGVLVAWTATQRDPAQWSTWIRDPLVRHVALPDPRIAPYGRAALQALDRLGLRAEIQPRFVIGESVAQASQFVASGAAEFGFTAKSIATALTLPGRQPLRWAEVDPALYEPIAQDAVLLRHAAGDQTADARAAFAFLFSDAARALLARHGYRLPPR